MIETKNLFFRILPFFVLIAILLFLFSLSTSHIGYGMKQKKAKSNPTLNDRLFSNNRPGIQGDKDDLQTRKYYQKFTTKKIGGVLFVFVPAGHFVMGQAGLPYAQPMHKVQVNGFWMASHETTQRIWRRVMGTNPSFFANCGLDCPVENVSWNEIQKFLTRFNGRFAIPNDARVRLPSEREWEYAARANTKTNFYWGNVRLAQSKQKSPADLMVSQFFANSSNKSSRISIHQSKLGPYFWYRQNARYGPKPVGKKPANAFGLFDMAGNVAEWTQDCMHFSYKNGPRTGRAWLHENQGQCRYYRVIRGGAWKYPAAYSQSAARDWSRPYLKNNSDGFRMVLEVK